MRVGACQVPDIRGDVAASLAEIEQYAREAESQGVKLLCFPECFLQGYLLGEVEARQYAMELASPEFQVVLQRLARLRPMLVLGLIEIDENVLFNTAAVINHGRLVGAYRKTHLFAGENIFRAGESYPIFNVDGLKFGINICYDTQFPEAAAAVVEQGADLILCPANNMLRRENAEKWKHRHNEIRVERVRETGLWLVSSDVTGERDGRIAYGPTAVLDPKGEVVAQVPELQTGLVIANIPVRARKLPLLK